MPLSKKVSGLFSALLFLVKMEKNNRKEEQDSKAVKGVGKTKKKVGTGWRIFLCCHWGGREDAELVNFLKPTNLR